MDQQKLTLLVLLNLSAAFDTISINRLTDIFDNHFKIKQNAIFWIKSYLTNRNQRISIQNTMSEMFQLNQGVPQGSCLGPIAFLTYISTLHDSIKDYLPSVETFADDTQLYISFKSEKADTNKATSEVEKFIDKIRSWMLSNNLLINDSKTEVLILGNKSLIKN